MAARPLRSEGYILITLRRCSSTACAGGTAAWALAVNAVEAFALQLGSGLHKRNLIQKIMLIDGVATRVRRKMEETIRNSQENAGGGRRRSREV
jgi:hypothetical protein